MTATRFRRRKPQPRTAMISLRVTRREDDQLAAMARPLGMASKSEVLRAAMDFYLAKSPEARAAIQSLSATTPAPAPG